MFANFLDTLGPGNKIANIAPQRFLNVLRPPNLQGTLLVTIPSDSDHFQLNRTSFRKMFIFVHFVHYRNQGTDFRLYEALFISTRVPLHHGTAFNRIWVKLWPYKACYNPVTSVCKISDTSSAWNARLENCYTKFDFSRACMSTIRARATRFDR